MVRRLKWVGQTALLAAVVGSAVSSASASLIYDHDCGISKAPTLPARDSNQPSPDVNVAAASATPGAGLATIIMLGLGTFGYAWWHATDRRR